MFKKAKVIQVTIRYQLVVLHDKKKEVTIIMNDLCFKWQNTIEITSFKLTKS